MVTASCTSVGRPSVNAMERGLLSTLMALMPHSIPNVHDVDQAGVVGRKPLEEVPYRHVHIAAHARTSYPMGLDYRTEVLVSMGYCPENLTRSIDIWELYT